MADYNEKPFEMEICHHLEANGWLYSENGTGYDRERALFPEDIFGWLGDTQPEQLAKIVKPTASAKDQRLAKERILDRIVKVLGTPAENGGGTLNLLRRGFKETSAKFDMCQPRPATTHNPTTAERYAKIRVRVMRQVYYSLNNKNSLDLVLFVNGLPVATVELKTDFTQSIREAIAQYKTTRLPVDPVTKKPEPLFGFGSRALVHFAVSNDEVWMSTRLAGADTRFLPFNMGDDGGEGNPPAPDVQSRSSYLWQRVLQRDSWLNIIAKFLHTEIKVDTDPITGKTTKSTTLLFPRFHQWEAVTQLLATARTEGPGHRYLIQHSAGSGKTNSISWTAHGLATLHDADNTKIFDSVIVVTDRTVLDDQLQDAIQQIDSTAGVVLTVTGDEAGRTIGADGQPLTSKSALLAKALLDGKLIIVVTIQTFPFAMDAIRKTTGLKDKKFAVIAPALEKTGRFCCDPALRRAEARLTFKSSCRIASGACEQNDLIQNVADRNRPCQERCHQGRRWRFRGDHRCHEGGRRSAPGGVGSTTRSPIAQQEKAAIPKQAPKFRSRSSANRIPRPASNSRTP